MRLAIISLFASCSFGCKSTVLLEDTELVSELIHESITETRNYYNELGRRRFDSFVEFVAWRPSCGVTSTLLIVDSEHRCLTDAEKILRRKCAEDPKVPDCALLPDDVREIPASPELTQPRQTTITILAIVAAYQQALINVLEDESFDTASEVKNLISRLGELCNNINKLKSSEKRDPDTDSAGNSDSDTGTVEEGDSDANGEEISCEELDVGTGADTDNELDQQIAAVGTLLNLVRQARKDQADFKALVRIVENQGPAVDSALERLLFTYERVDKPFYNLLGRQEIERQRRDYNDLSHEERRELGYEIRKERVRAIYEAELARLLTAAQPDALAAGLRAVIRSHRQLQKSLKGDLTPEQRKRIAAETRIQLKAAFKSMLSIVKVFT